MPPSMLSSVTTGTSLWGSAVYAGPGGSAPSDGEDLVSERLGATSLSLSYDANDHLNGTATNGGAVAPVGVDAAGNHTSLGSSTYTFSGRNLLATAESGLSFYYDGFGQRILTKQGSTLEASLYDQQGYLITEILRQSSVRAATFGSSSMPRSAT